MKEIIQFYRDENSLMNDSIDRIIVEVHKYKEKNYQSFLLTGCGQANGTTTLSINLAIGLAACGWKVALVDCDLRKQMKYKRLNRDVARGLSDYLENDVELGLGDIIYKTSNSNMDYLPGGSVSESPVRLFCSQKMEELVAELKKRYDYIIFDVPSINVVPDAEIIIPYIEGIMLIAGLNDTTKKQLHDARNKMKEFEGSYMGLIVNHVNLREYKKYRKDYDYYEEKKQSGKYLKALRNSTKKRKG